MARWLPYEKDSSRLADGLVADQPRCSWDYRGETVTEIRCGRGAVEIVRGDDSERVVTSSEFRGAWLARMRDAHQMKIDVGQREPITLHGPSRADD